MKKKGKDVKMKNTVPTTKFGEENIMIWGYFFSNSTSKIHIIKECRNGAIYCKILGENLFENFHILNFCLSWLFQRGNDPMNYKIEER